MNPLLNTLHPYPFEKLKDLLKSLTPSKNHKAINLSIGEPKHPVPPFIRQAMQEALDLIGTYPTTRGEPDLRQAIASWLEKRFHIPEKKLNPEKNILPVNGTREALFSIAQAVTDPGKQPTILMPNPFYQIYEGAARMAGAEPIYVDANKENGFLPNYHTLPESILKRTSLLYLCSPSNPCGAVFPLERLIQLIELAERYDFCIASDECYSEIWYDTPPPGLLQAAYLSGREDFRRCLVFHSLSKRSNMPGARSGFVAGDSHLIHRYFQLRTYTGCATPRFIQHAAKLAWMDEHHVQENRASYQQKLNDALTLLSPVLPVERPEAGFYLWLQVPSGGETFAQRLYEGYNVTVLPGAYLGRKKSAGINPGTDFVRIALVASLDENHQAMQRIAQCAATFF